MRSTGSGEPASTPHGNRRPCGRPSWRGSAFPCASSVARSASTSGRPGFEPREAPHRRAPFSLVTRPPRRADCPGPPCGRSVGGGCSPHASPSYHERATMGANLSVLQGVCNKHRVAATRRLARVFRRRRACAPGDAAQGQSSADFGAGNDRGRPGRSGIHLARTKTDEVRVRPALAPAAHRSRYRPEAPPPRTDDPRHDPARRPGGDPAGTPGPSLRGRRRSRGGGAERVRRAPA